MKIGRERDTGRNELNVPVSCAVVKDQLGFQGRLLFHIVHFKPAFPSTNGKQFEKLRAYTDLSDHTKLLKGIKSHPILQVLYIITGKDFTQ